MSEFDWRCWRCKEPTPIGVCLGPHPDFDWNEAVNAGHVEVPTHGLVFEGNHKRNPHLVVRR